MKMPETIKTYIHNIGEGKAGQSIPATGVGELGCQGERGRRREWEGRAPR
jgi:hypothetical protein